MSMASECNGAETPLAHKRDHERARSPSSQCSRCDFLQSLSCVVMARLKGGEPVHLRLRHGRANGSEKAEKCHRNENITSLHWKSFGRAGYWDTRRSCEPATRNREGNVVHPRNRYLYDPARVEARGCQCLLDLHCVPQPIDRHLSPVSATFAQGPRLTHGTSWSAGISVTSGARAQICCAETRHAY